MSDEEMPIPVALNLIIGDAPIARFLTGTESKRRIVPRLKDAGWPIFDCGGKNAARPSELTAEVIKRERAARGTQDAGRRLA
jgi:hypothetical protein